MMPNASPLGCAQDLDPTDSLRGVRRALPPAGVLAAVEARLVSAAHWRRRPPHVRLQHREIRSLWTSPVWAVAHTATLFQVRTTQRKGDMATARAIATFTAMGYDVSIPLT